MYYVKEELLFVDVETIKTLQGNDVLVCDKKERFAILIKI